MNVTFINLLENIFHQVFCMKVNVTKQWYQLSLTAKCCKPLLFCTEFYFFDFDCTGSWLLLRLFSSCSEWSLWLRCPGFSCCRARLYARGFSSWGSGSPELNSCGTWAQLFRDMWDLPGSRINPMSPALAGGFFTSEPPGKPLAFHVLSLDQNFRHIPDLLNLNLLFNRIPSMNPMHIKARDALLQ